MALASLRSVPVGCTIIQQPVDHTHIPGRRESRPSRVNDTLPGK